MDTIFTCVEGYKLVVVAINLVKSRGSLRLVLPLLLCEALSQ